MIKGTHLPQPRSILLPLREKVARVSGSDEGSLRRFSCSGAAVARRAERNPSSVRLRLTPSPARGEGPLAAAALLFATPALAHEGHHEQLTVAQQVRHLLTQPDHVLALAALVVLTVAGGWTWRRARARVRR